MRIENVPSTGSGTV